MLGRCCGTCYLVARCSQSSDLFLCMHVQGAQAACCTSGQPTYKGKEVNFAGLPTCSDGPCSGDSFNYLSSGASQSPDPESCCETDGTAFFYNPQATAMGATWPPIPRFPSKWPGTGRKCNAAAPRFRCSIGGQVGISAAAAAAANEV